LQDHFTEVESFRLIPSDGGRFEFSVDGELLYSKKDLKRHAEEGEIKALFEAYLAKKS